MLEQNLFRTFERPGRIPPEIISSIPELVAADEEVVSLTRQIGDLLQRSSSDSMEEDLIVFAQLFTAIANRPSTTSPVVIGILRGTRGGTLVTACWLRHPEYQNGYTDEWKDTQRTMWLDLPIPIDFARIALTWERIASNVGMKRVFIEKEIFTAIPPRQTEKRTEITVH
jgi:hypothetical protein